MGRKSSEDDRGGCCTHRWRGQQSIIYPGAKKSEKSESNRNREGLIKIEKWFRRIFIIGPAASSWIRFSLSHSKILNLKVFHFFFIISRETRIRYRRGGPREQSLMAFLPADVTNVVHAVMSKRCLCLHRKEKKRIHLRLDDSFFTLVWTELIRNRKTTWMTMRHVMRRTHCWSLRVFFREWKAMWWEKHHNTRMIHLKVTTAVACDEGTKEETEMNLRRAVGLWPHPLPCPLAIIVWHDWKAINQPSLLLRRISIRSGWLTIPQHSAAHSIFDAVSFSPWKEEFSARRIKWGKCRYTKYTRRLRSARKLSPTLRLWLDEVEESRLSLQYLSSIGMSAPETDLLGSADWWSIDEAPIAHQKASPTRVRSSESAKLFFSFSPRCDCAL